jgi:phosphatidylglycerophosphate synthase
MQLYTYIYRECPVKIWGLTSRQRIERVLKADGKSKMVHDLNALHDDDFVLILRADHLFDDRLVKYLAATPNIVLQLNGGPKKVAVAAHVPASIAHQALDVIEETAMAESLPDVKTQTLETLSISFQERIRKFDPPFVLSISAEKSRDLERRLFAWSYKGVTDLITKWVWPIPARWVVGQCVRFGIRPNHVTLTGLLLVILAGVLFAYGHYGWGLLAGWVMTFLDTVDGKLARVTVTSSRFGHYFDHIIDIVHPPIWYILWGLGLKMSHPEGLGFSLNAVLWFIVIGYVVGRFTEVVFQQCLGRFGIFCWRPMDSYFRLITARRNPNMILLTGCFFVGRPDFGLLAVAFWTVWTSFFLLLRLAWAGYARIIQGPLKSWFMDVNPSLHDKSLAIRLFTRYTTDQ